MVQYLLLGSRIGFRAASRVVEATVEFFRIRWQVPVPTTARNWLLRIALYQLLRAKTISNDWVWIVDHTVKIGPEKCLVVMGVPLSQLPPAGQPLELRHLQLLSLLPVTHSDQHVVFQQLEQTATVTGVPQRILSDHGSDLQAGINRFCVQHSETTSHYDVTHKAAILLKSRLEKDPQWKAFSSQAGQTKFQTQQTELAFLVPPSQRSKARFMNLGPLLTWARKTLEIIQQHPPEVLQHCSAERLEAKLGWLRDYQASIKQWSEYQELLDHAVDEVRRYGYGQSTAYHVGLRLLPFVNSEAGRQLKDALIAFVEQESSAVPVGESIPGSTEILESAFGRLKSMEGDQSKGGFTSLLLSLGALVGTIDRETIMQALSEISQKRVDSWIKDNLGQTQFSKRKKAFADCNNLGVNTVNPQLQL